MVLDRKEVMAALHNETPTHIPVSFWRHFADNEFTDAAEQPAVIQTNLNGHQDYYQQVHVDFAKTMLDGYFPYPFRGVKNPLDPAQLSNLQPLTADDPWITGQVNLARQQQALVGNRPVFITMFSPVILFKWALFEHYVEPLTTGDHRFADLYVQHPETVTAVLHQMAKDLRTLATTLMANTKIDGIYYSTQSIQDSRVNDHRFFEQVMEPIDMEVQSAINEVSPLNILHICGFDGATNQLEWFKDYSLQVINWATGVDHYSLGAGKKLFNDRPVLGGFDNSTKGVLYTGTKQQIQNEVRRLIDEVGTQGVLIGADCTVPRDISYQRLNWAIEAAHQI